MQIKIFISHSWSYSGHYEKLHEWIFNNSWSVDSVRIHFEDKSVPQSDPIHNANNSSELRQAIYTRIWWSDIVVIPTGMYANYSKWIKEEIEGALKFKKPILAVDPWGQERKSSIVGQNASKTVGWNSQSVVSGVVDLYRHANVR